MSAAGRLAAAVTTAGAVVFAAGPAVAAGTGGVELTPLATNASAFHTKLMAGHRSTEKFALRNITGAPAEVHLYAAEVKRGTGASSGAWAVAGAGSAPWIGLPAQDVHLAPHTSKTFSFTVDRDTAPRGEGMTYGAVVVQTSAGNVVSRAATLVYLDRVGPGGAAPVTHPPVAPSAAPVAAGAPMVQVGHPGGLPGWLAAVAGTLVALVGGAVVRSLARRSRRTAPASA